MLNLFSKDYSGPRGLPAVGDESGGAAVQRRQLI
jgi:hypothetical protein